jgi:hypothetical protein
VRDGRRGAGHGSARHGLGATLVACLALALAGCGSGSSGSATPPANPPPSPTASSSGPAVVPAAGRKVDLAAFTARAPQGFRYDDSLAQEFVSASSRDYDTFEVEYSDITIFPGAGTHYMAKLTVKNGDWHPKPTIAAPVHFADATWYHLVGRIGGGKHLEEYGTVVQGASAPRLVKVSFEMKSTPARRARLVASVLATVRLK